jgi:hypothetical protein
MRGSFAARRFAIIVSALLPGLIQQNLWGQQQIPPAQVPEAFRGLQQLGDLRLKTYSIHGLAPLVVLFTEAPASAPEVERRYRHNLTSTLLWHIERLGVSLFSLHPTRQASESSDVDQFSQDALATFDTLRGLPPWGRPRVFIGFADGAVAAARELQRDSSSAALIALAPSLGEGATAAQEVLWQELLSPTDLSRPVLVLESLCNIPNSGLAQVGSGRRVTLLLLPQYDGWLSRQALPACSTTPAHSAGMDYELISVLTNWLRQTVAFPE